jgi:hypothetical protein
MDPESAIENYIEPTLRKVFGLSETRHLLAMATLAYITADGGKIRRYRAFVESLRAHDRLLRKWDAKQVAAQCEEWKNLVPLEPQPVVVLMDTTA